MPRYPAEAQSKKIYGAVVMDATIDEFGKVRDAKVLQSIPELDQAAVDAVKQWEFTPTIIDGVPTPIIMTVVVNFTANTNLAPPSSRPEPAGPMETRAMRTGPPLLAPARIAGDLPSYPSKAKDNAHGTVVLMVTVDDKGHVREARAVSDQREVFVAPGRSTTTNEPLGKPFVEAAIKAVKKWQYPSPGPIPIVYVVRVHFVPGKPVEAM